MLAFHHRTNHLVDSFSLRIPKRTKSAEIRNLWIFVSANGDHLVEYAACDGLAKVELMKPDVLSLLFGDEDEVVARTREFLFEGLQIAATHDTLFATNMPLWRQLLETADQALDYDLGVSRAHPSRRWMCHSVLRIGPKQYHYDLVVRDSRTGVIRKRHRYASTACVFPVSYDGPAKLRWEGGTVHAMAEDGEEMFRFDTGLD